MGEYLADYLEKLYNTFDFRGGNCNNQLMSMSSAYSSGGRAGQHAAEAEGGTVREPTVLHKTWRYYDDPTNKQVSVISPWWGNFFHWVGLEER